jgi:anti-anti-sigma factor
MFNASVEKMGDVAVIRCEGRLVRSEEALSLRHLVTALPEARALVLDLSALSYAEGGGLAMLAFLRRWASDHGIEFRLFEPSDRVRDSLERTSLTAELEIAGIKEVLDLLGWVQPANVPAWHANVS